MLKIFTVDGLRSAGSYFRGKYRTSTGRPWVSTSSIECIRGFVNGRRKCATYPPSLKLSALDALERSLNGYIARIMQHAVRTDAALRGARRPV